VDDSLVTRAPIVGHMKLSINELAVANDTGWMIRWSPERQLLIILNYALTSGQLPQRRQLNGTSIV